MAIEAGPTPGSQPEHEMEMTGAPHVLRAWEREQLRLMEDEIALAERAGSRAGWSYRTIKRKNLWRESYSSWSEYCATRWGRSKADVDRKIWHADLSDWLSERGLETPSTERQSRPLRRFRDKTNVVDEATVRTVVGMVTTRGGWPKVTASEVERIAEDLSPRTATRDVAPIRSLVLVTRGGQMTLSTRAKARILRGLQMIAEESNALQALGPHAVPDALRAMTETESNEAREAAHAAFRFLNRFADAWSSERGEQPETGQQQLRDEDDGRPMAA